MKQSKNFTQYQARLFAALEAIHQTSLASIIASAALEDFPKNVPAGRRQAIEDVFRQLGKDFQTAAEQATEVAEDGSEPLISVSSKISGTDAAGLGAAMILALRLLGGREVSPLDFSELLRRQELAMLYAHLEAFLNDTLRYMCGAKPQLLARKKQIAWADVVKARSRRQLIDQLVEEYAYEFGWKSFEDKVSYLRTNHGIVVSVTDENLQSITDGESVRHVIIHNSGRASVEYLRRTRRRDLQVGNEIHVSDEQLQRLRWTIAAFCTELFTAVSQKYFRGGSPKVTIGQGG